jgi:hypothetical protein
LAERGTETAEVRDCPGDVLVAGLKRSVELGEIARGGLEPLQARGELLAVVPREPLARRLEEELEVGPGVAVQGREDLVGLDVGLRLGERDRRSLLDRALRGPGVDLDRHVLQTSTRPQEETRVRVDERRVLVVDLHVHDRASAVQRDPGEGAHLDSGDGHRLTLAGGDGL